MSLLSSSKCCTQLLWLEVVKIGFGGSLSKKAWSTSSRSLASWLVLMVVISLGRVCSGLRLLQE
jgi:hypothetical protein